MNLDARRVNEILTAMKPYFDAYNKGDAYEQVIRLFGCSRCGALPGAPCLRRNGSQLPPRSHHAPRIDKALSASHRSRSLWDWTEDLEEGQNPIKVEQRLRRTPLFKQLAEQHLVPNFGS